MPAPGYESAEPVILQGHMDMVCEKEPGCTKDMAVDGLDLVLEGDTVSAKGTTLGGDDGIAVAMALAILDDTSLSHPAIEAIFTVDEETGMYGAEGLDVSVLKGRPDAEYGLRGRGSFHRQLCRRRPGLIAACPSAASNSTPRCRRSPSPAWWAVTPARRSTRAAPTAACCWAGSCAPWSRKRPCG